MEQLLLDIMKWLLPTGCLGSVVAWLINRTNHELRQIKESHDVYKAMYEDLKNTLQDEIEEKKQLRRAVGRFERAISKVFNCKYYPNCPVNIELKENNERSSRPISKHSNGRQSGDRGDTDKDGKLKEDKDKIELKTK